MELIERLEKRKEEFRSCTTTEEFSLAIWSKGFENAVGSNKQSYRDCLIDWVECYKLGNSEAKWKYKTPQELANAIYVPYLDEPNDIWFPALRREIVDWIEKYKLS